MNVCDERRIERGAADDRQSQSAAEAARGSASRPSRARAAATSRSSHCASPLLDPPAAGRALLEQPAPDRRWRRAPDRCVRGTSRRSAARRTSPSAPAREILGKQRDAARRTRPWRRATAAGSSRRCARTCATAAGSTGKYRPAAPCRSRCRTSTLAMMLPCDSITPFGRPECRTCSRSSPALVGKRRDSAARRRRRQGRSDRRQRSSPAIGTQHIDAAGSVRPPSRERLRPCARALDDQRPRLGIGGAPRDVVRIVVDVERDDDDPQSERGQVERDPVDAVSQADRDAVAGCEAQRPQRRLPAPDQRREFADV